MSDRLILTNMPVNGREVLAGAIQSGTPGRVRDFFLYPASSDEPKPGEIYVGRIQNLHRQTDGAFIRLRGNQMVYLPLHGAAGCDAYVMKTRRESGAQLRAGDELLIQIDVSAQKLKQPRASGELNLAGRYLAISNRDPGLHFSRKLTGEEKKRIRTDLMHHPGASQDCAIIVRTNAAEANRETLLAELQMLQQQMQKLLTEGRREPSGTCLLRAEQPWRHLLDRIAYQPETTIETDRKEIYAELQEIVSGVPEAPVCRLVQDPQIPLWQLRRLSHTLERLLAKRVHLKSGGFLVIEQTEAFVSIDVNSGKFTGNLPREQMARKINLEAADEILRQIRLRQLSGTILIDFINQDNAEDTRALLNRLACGAAEDPVRTSVIDMTKLGIVEMTREKRYPLLAEQVRMLV